MAIVLNPSLANWARLPQTSPFLLDNVPGAQAAFSPRKLSSSYSGPALRVRRSSDNAESDIGFNASGDLDTAALLAFIGANSGFINTFYDQTGGGAHYTQGTTGSQPRIVNAGVVDVINTRPALLYDGSNDTLIGNATANGILQNRTGMTLLTTNNFLTFATSNRSIISFSNGLSGASIRLTVTSMTDAGATANRGFNARALDANGLSQRISASKYDGSFSVNSWTIDYTTASGVSRRNGAVIDSGTFVAMSGGATSNTASIGTAIASFNNGQFASANIADIIIYPRVITGWEMTFAESNLATYYGVTI
jgi:hypothetical protein